MLVAIEEARGQPSKLVTDGAEIQLFVAERHGAQRARLGWSREALQREWSILREEIDQLIRRSAGTLPESAVAEAQIVLERVLEQAEDGSIRALERVRR
jgi:phage shock protein A